MSSSVLISLMKRQDIKSQKIGAMLRCFKNGIIKKYTKAVAEEVKVKLLKFFHSQF
jgi:hypothetical protein